MKNNYRKLKFSILLETVLITALTVLVGGFPLNYVVDGIYNDSFAKGVCQVHGNLSYGRTDRHSFILETDWE